MQHSTGACSLVIPNANFSAAPASTRVTPDTGWRSNKQLSSPAVGRRGITGSALRLVCRQTIPRVLRWSCLSRDTQFPGCRVNSRVGRSEVAQLRAESSPVEIRRVSVRWGRIPTTRTWLYHGKGSTRERRGPWQSVAVSESVPVRGHIRVHRGAQGR